MGVKISRGVLQRILAHAAREPEREVCGLLLNTPSTSVRAERSRGTATTVDMASASLGRSLDFARDERIGEFMETTNVSPNPANSFEIDPAALFTALRAERTGGPRLIGHYHSHPNGVSTPSACDAMMVTSPGRLWLIVGSGEARLWREVAGGAVHGAFEPVELLGDGADEGCA
jgi:proteasome lid subunit RPN8/RPN11